MSTSDFIFNAPTFRRNSVCHINKSVVLRTTFVPRRRRKRPLIILFAWLNAKERHLERYRQLYLQRGFDVITVKAFVKQLIFPLYGIQSIMKHLLNFLIDVIDEYDGICIHAFSIGLFCYGEFLLQLKRRIVKETNEFLLIKLVTLKQLLRSTVLDSPLDFSYATEIFRNKKLLKTFFATLFSFKYIRKHYLETMNVFHQHSLRSPTLILASFKDHLANPSNLQNLVSTWKDNNAFVFCKFWDDSLHVKHFVKHRAEYEFTVDQFLRKTGLVQGNVIEFSCFLLQRFQPISHLECSA